MIANVCVLKLLFHHLYKAHKFVIKMSCNAYFFFCSLKKYQFLDLHLIMNFPTIRVNRSKIKLLPVPAVTEGGKQAVR